MAETNLKAPQPLWRSVKRHLPGYVLDAGRPAHECSELYSVDCVGERETASPRKWTLYRATKVALKRRAIAEVVHIGEFTAHELYRHVEESELSIPLDGPWRLQANVWFPSVQDAYWEQVEEMLPGVYLGTTVAFGSVMEWETRLSLTWDGVDGWNFHRCGEPQFWLDPPEIQTDWSCSKGEVVEMADELGLDGRDVADTIQSLRNVRTELMKIRLEPPGEKQAASLRILK